MTDLSSLPDDVIVAEMQRRLDRGSVGWRGLLSTDQANHRDNWMALLEMIHHCENTYPRQFGVKLIGDKVRELADKPGPQTRPYAINTTFHGRGAYEDHAPKSEPVKKGIVEVTVDFLRLVRPYIDRPHQTRGSVTANLLVQIDALISMGSK